MTSSLVAVCGSSSTSNRFCVSTTAALAISCLRTLSTSGAAWSRPVTLGGVGTRTRCDDECGGDGNLNAPDGILYAPDASVGTGIGPTCEPGFCGSGVTCDGILYAPEISRSASAEAAVAFGGSGVSVRLRSRGTSAADLISSASEM